MMPDQPTDAARDEATAWAIFHPDRKGPPTITAIAQALAAARNEGCPHGGNCACAIGSRHFWHKAFCEERDKLEAAVKQARAEGARQEREKTCETCRNQIAWSDGTLACDLWMDDECYNAKCADIRGCQAWVARSGEPREEPNR